jgi:hypothetical protein
MDVEFASSGLTAFGLVDFRIGPFVWIKQDQNTKVSAFRLPPAKPF